jgi:hypothetical protein
MLTYGDNGEGLEDHGTETLVKLDSRILPGLRCKRI